MKISLNSMQGLCQRYGCLDNLVPEGVDNLVTKIGAQLGEIEDITYVKNQYDKAVIVHVVSVEKHPNADKLHVCMVDDGGRTPEVSRSQDKTVQVVCGAPNVRAGMLAVWLPPGATVPDSYSKDPFVLEARELRGVISNGMLASPKELALGDKHDGILEVNDDGIAKPGMMFGDAYELTDDVQIDIENKMFTHRPDCFGFLGVAREMAGIQGLTFKSPDWYTPDAAIAEPETDTLALELRNELPSLVQRFMLLPMRDVQVGASPVWLQVELAKVGVKSINNIVDYTNFFMLETGQPLHAYDYDKVKALSGGDGAVIEVRNPRDNERIKLLNGKEIDPRQEAIMIATDKALIGVGGVMGGSETEVDENTKNIILEVGTFDMYSVRRTSMEHGLFTDAVTRFNKGQSPLQNRAVLAKVVDEIRKFAGGKVAGPVIDDNQAEGRQWVHPPVPVTADFINARLGFSLSPEDIKVILEHVEFQVAIEGNKLSVT
ncbi:phenylalanine--tRNA ligase subunit beta, partial [Candidatus Saccharibacteria bacterium]|nr:phenylalanine--tRNA ligase subunit beta [Candidatus Saccharibacteria bacterium]